LTQINDNVLVCASNAGIANATELAPTSTLFLSGSSCLEIVHLFFLTQGFNSVHRRIVIVVVGKEVDHNGDGGVTEPRGVRHNLNR
jgi:hypothetical protein